MTGLIMVLHALVCILLIVIILMQSGRGGGLTEAFASAESMFGAKTNELLIKGTTILATLFLITCLSLAVLSTKKDKSLMSEAVLDEPQGVEQTQAVDQGEKAVTQTQQAVDTAKDSVPEAVR